MPGDAAAGPPSPASLSSSAALPAFSKARERGGKGTTDPASAPLPEQIASLAETASALAGQVGMALGAAQSLSGGAEELAGQGIVYAAWVVEALAARRGVALSKGKGPKGAADGAGGSTGTAGIEASLDKLLADAAANVDRIERLPSPYLWKVLADLEARATEIAGRIEDLGGQLAVAEAAAGGGTLAGDGSGGRRGTMGMMGMEGGGRGGHGHLPPPSSAMSSSFSSSSASAPLPPSTMALVPFAAGGDGRGGYGYDYAGAPSPYQGRASGASSSSSAATTIEEDLATAIRRQADAFLLVAASVATAHDALDELRARYRVMASAGGDDPFALADAREAEDERRVQERIRSDVAAAAGAAAAAQAPPPGSAQAPAAGGLFGAPAPAAATGGLFGAPAPASAAGGFGFGAPAPAPAAGGFGFGAASPAAAPAAGGLFGAPAPAPPPATSIRSRSKSRSTRRR
jgi:hypothetical protein